MGAPNFPAGGGLRGQRWFRRAERVAAESTVALPVPWQAARIATFACEDKMGSVIDDYLVDPKVSLLDKTRMQAQVLLPVLRAFRAEFGKDKADAIVKQALRDWSKQLFAAIGDGIEGGPRRKWAAINSVFGEVSGKEVEIEILRHDEEALDIDVTRCRFAEFFRALGEPELGALLICEADFDIASVGEGAVSLDRAQTIMQGAPSCTFRYKFAPR
jgi:L-2-amino-thiazoline-4-carboxylic acid hydrolase